MQQLTVIMPHLNEGDEPLKTVASLYASCSPDEVSVIAIQDGPMNQPSPDFSRFPGVQSLVNNCRIGVDACRDKGVQLARTPYILIIDAHMRFTQDDWLQRLLAALRDNPRTLFCTRCLSLGWKDEKQPDGSTVPVWHDMDAPTAEYRGATILVSNDFSDPIFLQRDGKPKVGMEVLEPKWLPREHTDIVIPCVLGANYACSAQWWRYIRGVNGLMGWGSSEPFMSLKTWMAGGRCELLDDISIGHVFRDNAPYGTPVWCIIYNKLLLLDLLFPARTAERMRALLAASVHPVVMAEALAHRHKMEQGIAEEREILQSVFSTGVLDVLDTFGIPYPKDDK